jgi:hypothetical protein
MVSGSERLPVPVDSSSLEEALSSQSKVSAHLWCCCASPWGKSPLLPCQPEAVSPWHLPLWFFVGLQIPCGKSI